MNKSIYLIKNIGILTVSNFASKILVFLLVPLYTSVLSTAEYGTYDLVVSTSTLLYPILTLNIVDAVMRFSMDKAVPKEKIAIIGLKFIFNSVLIAAIVLFVVSRLNIWENVKGLEIFIFLYYVSYIFNQFMIQFAKGLERVTDMGIAGVISTVIMIVANVVFLIALKLGLIGFFLANILSQFVSAVYIFLRVRFKEYITNNIVDKQLLQEMLAYCIPLIATMIGWWVNSTSDKYVVALICGVSANGILSVSYKIPQIINTFQNIFTQAWQISAIKEYGEDETANFYGKTFALLNFLMCVVCSCLVLFTKPLAHILYSKDFYIAWKYVPFLLVSSVLNCASGLLGPILSAQKNTKAMMWSAIIAAVSNIILNIILVNFIGVQGATIATAICSYIIYAIRRKAVGNDVNIKNNFIIPITWVLLCVQACIEIYFQHYTFEIILMIVMLILNGKILTYLLSAVKATVKATSKSNINGSDK